MTQIRMGILGCGQIALGTHLPILARNSDVKIVALAEPDASLRQRALAIAPGATAVADWRDVIARDDVDAVVICLPSSMHCEAGAAALRARKHIYLEKPIACNQSDARHVIDAHNASGCVGMIGFNYRFHPLAIDLKSQIEKDRIGKVIGAHCVFCTSARELPPWKTRRASGGGVLLDLASHYVDLIHFLLGCRTQSVFARTTTIKTEADTATIDLRTSTGAHVQALFSLRSAEENRIEIFGTEGKLSLDMYRSTSVQFTPASGGAGPIAQLMDVSAMIWQRGRKLIKSKLDPGSNQISWRAALGEFVAAVQHKRTPACGLHDGLASLEVVDAAEISARTQTVVEMEAQAPTPDRVSAPMTVHDPQANPKLSVILGAPGSASVIAATLRALRAQTIIDQLELVLVCESREKLSLNPAMVEGFHDVQIIEVGLIRSVAHADAEGVRAASAPIVAFAEDHAFPDATWAQALLDAHRGPWAAVGPLMANANPDTAVSCADLLFGYGPWLDPMLCGERSHLPGHNSSYKRQALLDYGPRLEAMLDAETLIQWDMRARGLQLFQAVDARVRHTNISLLGPFADVSFNIGRAFGAARAANWPVSRKAIFCLASPLIPFVRLYRIVRDNMGSPTVRRTLRRGFPALFLGLCLDGLGQMLGYALGPGGSAERLKLGEFDRARNVTAKDRQALFAAPDELAVDDLALVGAS